MGDRRWVILGEDGRFVTLGRASDPSESEIAGSEKALLAQGLAGWLAIMEGNPYAGPLPRLMCVRPLATPTRQFSEAAAACVTAIKARRAARGTNA